MAAQVNSDSASAHSMGEGEADSLHLAAGSTSTADTASINISDKAPSNEDFGSSAAAVAPAMRGEDNLSRLRREAAQLHDDRNAYSFPKCKTALAVFLLATGLVMVISGMAVDSLAMGLVGAFLTMPGAYYSWGIFKSWRGDWRSRQRFYDVEEREGDEDMA